MATKKNKTENKNQVKFRSGIRNFLLWLNKNENNPDGLIDLYFKSNDYLYYIGEKESFESNLLEFCVESNSYETYLRFKNDIEKFGFTYNAKFNQYGFSEKSIEFSNCIYIRNNWNIENDYSFAFSNCAGIQRFYIDIEDEYERAVNRAELIIKK